MATTEKKAEEPQAEPEIEDDGSTYVAMTQEPDFDPANYDVKQYAEKNKQSE